MLSADGCRDRRQRLWQVLGSSFQEDQLVLADPAHLMYLANFNVDPISLGAGFGGYLVLRRDGRTTLFHDDRLPQSVQQAHVDERQVVPWYDGQSPAHGPRQLACREVLDRLGLRVHDHPDDPQADRIIRTLTTLRRQKNSDEVDLLRRCLRAGEAGHAWARANIQPGMTELDVAGGVQAACIRAAGQVVLVYGDFAVSPGPARRGGPPTDRVLQPGDMFILDYSVVIGGYRDDITNTLVVGLPPRPEQQRLYELCVSAMAAGEKELRRGCVPGSLPGGAGRVRPGRHGRVFPAPRRARPGPDASRGSLFGPTGSGDSAGGRRGDFGAGPVCSRGGWDSH